MQIRNPGWKKFGSGIEKSQNTRVQDLGSGINIPVRNTDFPFITVLGLYRFALSFWIREFHHLRG
jgi:hypothetical protein